MFGFQGVGKTTFTFSSRQNFTALFHSTTGFSHQVSRNKKCFLKCLDVDWNLLESLVLPAVASLPEITSVTANPLAPVGWKPTSTPPAGQREDYRLSFLCLCCEGWRVGTASWSVQTLWPTVGSPLRPNREKEVTVIPAELVVYQRTSVCLWSWNVTLRTWAARKIQPLFSTAANETMQLP